MLLSLIIIAVLYALTGCTSGAIGALVVLGLWEAVRFALKRAS